MAKHAYPVIANNTTTLLGSVVKKRDFHTWKGLFFVYGTFGSGTIAWKWSPDGGTTKLAMTDYGGAAVLSTANDSFVSEMCTGSDNSDKILLYAALTGATNPNLIVGFYDNN